MIRFVCLSCGKQLAAPEGSSGKKSRCPKCQSVVVVPNAESPLAPAATEAREEKGAREEKEAPASPGDSSPLRPGKTPTSSLPTETKQTAGLDDDDIFGIVGGPAPVAPPRPPAAGFSDSRPKGPVSAAAAAVPKKPPRVDLKTTAAPKLRSKSTPLLLRHMHWLLLLALVPLMVSILTPHPTDEREKQFIATLESLPEERQAEIILALEEGTADDLLAMFPGGKLQGALLARDSLVHWGMAIVATICFLAFFALLASDRSAEIHHLLMIGLFTSTMGIFLLLSIQFIADSTQGFAIRGRGIGMLIYLIFKFIGFSYAAAMNPDNGFWLSFLGFTCGVGFCEEVTKGLPLFWKYKDDTDQAWRGAFLWGLASGAGFGIAEGIMYSASYYNGVEGGGIYFVRFISCVALHAVWAGSVGISANQNRHWFDDPDSWYEYILPILRFIWVPMLLHGLYDTFLKREMNLLALFTAMASFGFLAFQIYRLRGQDDAQNDREFLAAYQRSKS